MSSPFTLDCFFSAESTKGFASSAIENVQKIIPGQSNQAQPDPATGADAAAPAVPEAAANSQ